MIYLLASGDHDAASRIVQSALERSCGHGQVQRVSFAQWMCLQSQNAGVLSAIINPPEAWAGAIAQRLSVQGNKTLMFGALPPTLAKALGASVLPIDESVRESVQCQPAVSFAQANSPLSIEYAILDELRESPLPQRACLRYDFTDEWNNLGYGAVRADDTIWSLSQIVQLPKQNVLAALKLQTQNIGAYAGLWVSQSAANALLWFNRPVGPVDSQEWRLVERFLSDLGHPSLVCQPVLSEIPYGHDAAVTMRLDCDEDVESARPLWQAYQHMGVPFSLALHARVLSDERHHILPRDVLAHGGALLSHTATHAPDWGGSYAEAYEEGRSSAEVIKRSTGYRVRYAVSPFHQTPVYARAGLSDAGYEGCIGGIIRNDYDFLMARSGTPPEGVQGFIGHSQQCMLHGDCMLEGDDPLLIFKQAFAAAKTSRTFFGYLDHPFSERYQYGWQTEAQRVNMHTAFVDHIRAQGSVLFTHENDAMDFLYDRAAIMVTSDSQGFNIRLPSNKRSHLIQSVEYAGKRYPLSEQGLAL
jgi:peptidoglycan/xylan/chitin deacetylase (PgdA/CDA1 family)